MYLIRLGDGVVDDRLLVRYVICCRTPPLPSILVLEKLKRMETRNVRHAWMPEPEPLGHLPDLRQGEDVDQHRVYTGRGPGGP